MFQYPAVNIINMADMKDVQTGHSPPVLATVMIIGNIAGSRGGEDEDDSLWGIASCRLLEVDRRFRVAYCPHHQGDRPMDGGRKHL